MPTKRDTAREERLELLRVFRAAGYRVEYLRPDAGVHGPVEVWRPTENGREYLVAREVRVGQWARD